MLLYSSVQGLNDKVYCSCVMRRSGGKKGLEHFPSFYTCYLLEGINVHCDVQGSDIIKCFILLNLLIWVVYFVILICATNSNFNTVPSTPLIPKYLSYSY